MFGHSDDKDQQQADDNQQPAESFGQDTPQPGQDVWQNSANPTVVSPQQDDNNNPAFSSSVGGPADAPADNPVAQVAQDDQHHDDFQSTEQHEDAAPASGFASAAGGNDNNDLLDIKQQALTQLSPLVGHLDQSPEERFRTTMMMIQASDNQSLVHEAYEAAQQIGDEKARAQALLDVINEINYFTQNHQ